MRRLRPLNFHHSDSKNIIDTYTGNTVVTAGTLHLLDDAALTFKVTDVSHNALTGTGTITLNGNFAIDVSAVTATTGYWQLENADTLPGAYGNTFQVDGAVGGFASGTLSFAKRPQAAADPKISYLIQESDDLGLADVWTEAPAGPTYINAATRGDWLTCPAGPSSALADSLC